MASQETRDRWTITGARVTGRGHEREGLGCADAFAADAVQGVLCIAVADGAGSARYGNVGSRILCETAIQEFQKRRTDARDPPPEGADGPLLSSSAAEIMAEARLVLEQEVHGQCLRDYAATFIVILASERGVGSAHVGDGAAVVETPGGVLRTLSGPAETEYVNETQFVTDAGWERNRRLIHIEGEALGIAAFTDGCHQAVFPPLGGQPHSGFLGPVFGYVRSTPSSEEVRRELEALLRSPKVAQVSDDDKTLVIAVRRLEGPP